MIAFVEGIVRKKNKLNKDYLIVKTTNGSLFVWETMLFPKIQTGSSYDFTIEDKNGYKIVVDVSQSQGAPNGNAGEGYPSFAHSFHSPDNSRQKSIMAQVAVKCAVELAVARGKTELADITVSANQLLALMESMSK